MALFAGLIWWRGAENVGQVQQLSDQLATQVEQLWSQVENGAWGRRAGGKPAALDLDLLRMGCQASHRRRHIDSGYRRKPCRGGGHRPVSGRITPDYIVARCDCCPPAWRPAARDLQKLGRTLRLWCLGQLVDMAMVTSLVGIGLFALGVPLALTLALFAGLLNFVPYIGALAGAYRQSWWRLAQSPTLALWVAVLFLTVQMIEGNVIAPFVQKRPARCHRP